MNRCVCLFGAACVATIAATMTVLGQSPPELKIPQQPPPAPPAAVLDQYPAVTTERLLHPLDGEWLMLRRTYNGWGYSPLSQVTAENVDRLRPVWVMSTGVNQAHEAPPIVNGGVMFVATAYNDVIAIDVKTGRALWRYRKPGKTETRGKPVSRGVSLFGDKVYFSLTEAVLVSVDARTGKEVWRQIIGDNSTGMYMTAPPLVADGKLILGVSGGDSGSRGFIAAHDPQTGKQIWKTFTIPGPGEPGHDTWRGDDWKTGGGATWVTGNYDPETNLVYWGVGNAYPWLAVARPGDNLYTSSTIAVDAASGAIKGHFQYTPNESWDFDEVSPPLLVDYRRGGRNIKGLINFARSGYLYFLERSNGPMKFVEGKPYVTANVIKSLDPATGRPEFDMARKPDVGKIAEFCPSWHGAKNWPPGAYNPKARMIYASSQENICALMVGREVKTPAGETRYATTSRMFIMPGAEHLSEVQGWNVDTGQKVWAHKMPMSPNWGSMMTTGGGLVFSGGTNDRMFRAHDAATGKVLWQYPTNSGVYAPAISFLVDGKQHIAVVSGWGEDPRSTQAHLNRASPGNFPEVPEGGVIWVFAL